jgi:5-methylcytosine-specific restriction endonuclease McrBC GTP-binding regulatory subunit McrB
MRKLFEIKFVETAYVLLFGQQKRYIYEMRASYPLQSRNLNTGVEEIDIIEQTKSYAIELTLTGTGRLLQPRTSISGC